MIFKGEVPKLQDGPTLCVLCLEYVSKIRHKQSLANPRKWSFRDDEGGIWLGRICPACAKVDKKKEA